MRYQAPIARRLALLLFCLAAIGGPLLCQQFQQPVVIPTPAAPYSNQPIWARSVLHGDLDGDGKEDFLYEFTGSGTYAGYLLDAPLFNLGAGKFLPPGSGTGATFRPGSSLVQTIAPVTAHGRAVQISVQGAAPRYATVLVIPYTSGRVVDAAGNADSNFDFPGSSTPNFDAMLATDLNGDSANDVVVEDAANNYLYVLLNDGTGKFTLKTQYPLAAADGTGPILSGDIDGDGRIDLLVNNQTSHVVTPYFGHGDGTFAVGTPYTLPGGIFSMLLADVNGDGIPDLVVEGVNGALSYFPGSSTGLSNIPVAISTAQDGATGYGGHLIGIADLNGDGFPDILTATPAGISVLLAQQPLTSHIPYEPAFTLGGIYNAGPGRSSYAVADFNGDHHLDLAVDSPEGIAILYGNADGSFQTSRSYAAGQPAYSLALGKFTASGNMDAVVATGTPQLQLLTGDGVGHFTTNLLPSPASAPQTDAGRDAWSTVVAGDFDGDGKLDAALTGPVPSTALALSLEFGDGDGTFSLPVTQLYTGTVLNTPSTVGDFNGDGKSDLGIFTNSYCAAFNGGVTSRSGMMAVTDVHSGIPDSYPLVATGFLKNSGTEQDIACQDGGTVYVYRNNGDATFSQTAAIVPPAGYVGGSPKNFPTTGLFPSAILLADLDGDGNGDIISVFHNLASDPANLTVATANQVYIYWGNGDGTFTAPTILTPSRNFYQAAVADEDGDGNPDLILSDGYILSVLPGHGTARTFGAERHFLAGMGINSISTTTLNGKPALVVANGGAVFTSPAVNRGTLASNAEVNTGGITVLLTSSAATTPPTYQFNGRVTVTPTDPGYGRTFTITATLTPTGSTAPTPTGTVDFSVDGAFAGTGTIDATGTATFNVTSPAYPVGTYNITAAYSGDANYPSASFKGTLTVTLLLSQTMIVDIVTTIHYGEIIGDIAVVSAEPADPLVDTESVDGGVLNIFIDNVKVCELAVGGMTVKCPPPTGEGYPVGIHSLSATYTGNSYYAPSDSPPYTVTVIPDDTQGIVTSSSNPAILGTPVTFTATFTSAFATPVGTVTFYDGVALLGPGTLTSAGVATLTTSSLALGTHTITASFAPTLNPDGTANFKPSTTAPLSQTIVPPPLATNVLLGSNNNPSTFGQNVTFTAAVNLGAVVSMAVPTGTVAFTADGASIGTPTLNAQGIASVSLSTLAVGTHTLVATYSGGTDALGNSYFGSSATLTQLVNVTPPPGSFTLTVTPAVISVSIGGTAALQVTITPVNGFSQPVMLSCAGLPREATCAFTTDTIANGSGTTRLTVTAGAPHDCSDDTPYFVSSGPTTWLGLLGAAGLFFLLRRRRLLVKGIALSLALAMVSAITGCGHCTDLGVPPGTYTFTVTATTGAATGGLGIPTPIQETQSKTVQMVAHL